MKIKTIRKTDKSTEGDISIRSLFERLGWTEEMMEDKDGVWITGEEEIVAALPKVYSDDNTEQKILGFYINGKERIYNVTFADGNTYGFTGNHKLKTVSGWCRVDQLSPNDQVIKFKDGEETQLGINLIDRTDEEMMTADIEVDGSHTYQLANGCVSHNTVSELVDTSSGIHPRYAPHYIRTVRSDASDPLAKMMKEQNVPCEPDVTNPHTTWIFSFPKKAPETAVYRDERTAIEQLEHYKLFRDVWCDHNVSITVYVKPDEWLDVGSWVYKHWDSIGGVSFLPYTDHIYKQAPYQEITEEAYTKLVAEMPEIDFSQLHKYENIDLTTGMREFACVGGACEII